MAEIYIFSKPFKHFDQGLETRDNFSSPYMSFVIVSGLKPFMMIELKQEVLNLLEKRV